MAEPESSESIFAKYKKGAPSAAAPFRAQPAVQLPPPPLPPRPPLPPPPPPRPAEPPQPQPDPGVTDYLKKKVEELEKKLFETQEKALSFSMEQRNKEELQRRSLGQVEEMFNTLRASQRAEEADKRYTERLEKLEQQAAELKAGLDGYGAEGSAERVAKLEAAFDGLREADQRAGEELRSSEVSAAKLTTRLELAEARIGELRDRIAAGAEARLPEIYSKMGAAEAWNASQAAEMRELREKVASLDSDQAGVSLKLVEPFRKIYETDGRVSALEAKVPELWRLREDLSTLKDAVLGRDIVSAEDLRGAMRKMAEIESSFSDFSAKLAAQEKRSLEGVSALGTLEGRFDYFKTLFDNLRSVVDRLMIKNSGKSGPPCQS
ncbi:MAG: hypothetical protein PHV36_08885 [Elusimicrobiales bacterium]|nr:hypothetical protein [Elusimicrobiales bacterium]